MLQVLNSSFPKIIRRGFGISLLFLLAPALLVIASPSLEDVRALYIPPNLISTRTVSEVVHYAGQLPINGVVLHVKDPFGRISWGSRHYLAGGVNNRFFHGDLADIVNELKSNNIWTIAKVDVFADHRLVAHYPEMGLSDADTGAPWKDKNGLHWANPYDERVWAYIISLSREVAAMGFDEIQFDYIRFPSDGDLSAIKYPQTLSGFSRAQTIGRFLETAYTHLKSLNVALSVDLFGLVAWKTRDFGVGQVVEEIAPHVDVICPMFYPSHFPTGFLGKKSPGAYPYEIMHKSMQRLKTRTHKPLRPWIQGFWYPPEEITAQLSGIHEADGTGWSVWNPSGRYSATYTALARQNRVVLEDPVFYPPVSELKTRDRRLTIGNFRVVNFTNYREGFSILSLERSEKGRRSAYTYPAAVLNTLDEGIMDHILIQREIPVGKRTTKPTKKAILADLLVKDLKIDPRRMRPAPIYIDWENGCRFSPTIPVDRLNAYQRTAQTVFGHKKDLYMSRWRSDAPASETAMD